MEEGLTEKEDIMTRGKKIDFKGFRLVLPLEGGRLRLQRHHW